MSWLGKDKEDKEDPKPKTPGDLACDRLSDYFDNLEDIPATIYLQFDYLDGKPTIFVESAAPVDNSAISALTHVPFASSSANELETSQQIGFILGQMSRDPLKPRSVTIDFNSIQAPDETMLAQFVDKWLAKQRSAELGG